MSGRRRYGVVYDPLYGDEDLEAVGHGGGGEKEIGRGGWRTLLERFTSSSKVVSDGWWPLTRKSGTLAIGHKQFQLHNKARKT